MSIVVESNELLGERFLLDALGVGFCLTVVFFTLSLVIIGDCVDVVFVVAGDLDMISLDVVVG